MQTDFTPAQLADPEIAVANQVLRTCVHCGFCTATCPTFVLLGDELDSPRGRIYLIKDMLENDRDATAEVVQHIDRCLSCLSCMTTCPSGVNYMHLVDHARVHIERTYRRPWHDRLLRGVLAGVLTRPARLRLALLAAMPLRPLARLIPGQGVFARRLRAVLGLAPRHLPSPGPVGAPGTYPPIGARRGRVALLGGCAQSVLDPGINAAAIRLLTRLGIEVVVARAPCCGALTHHMGRRDQAMADAAATIAAWDGEIARGLDAIVMTTSGCGTTVKDYGFLFRNAEPALAEAAARVSALALDISEYLTRIDYAPTRPAAGITLAYHAACSLQHGQKITTEPKALLVRAGFTVKEPGEGHLCCGSAGTYNLLQPEIAARLKERKRAAIRATGASVIAAGNIGCLTQLAGDGLVAVHSIELLDWMAGGPRPAALGDAGGLRPDV